MRKIENFPSRLIATFLIILLVVGGAGVFALLKLNTSSIAREAEINREMEKVVIAERLRADVERTLASARGFLLTGSSSFLARTRESEAQVSRGLIQVRSGVDSVQGTRLSNQLIASINVYIQSLDELLSAREKGENLETVSTRFENELLPKRITLDRDIDAFLLFRQERLSIALNEMRQDAQIAARIAFIVVITSIFAGGAIAWWSSKKLATIHMNEKKALQISKQAIRARDQLLAVVAHDLRNPLSAITIKATLMRKSSALDKIHSHASGIESISMQMEHLIRSLLDATSLESGRFTIQRTPCAVTDLLNETTNVFASLASSKSIQLETSFSDEFYTLQADKERLLQVLSNLLGNAIRFTPEGGKIKMSAQKEGQGVRFSVSDNGPGIALVNMPRLFERFWKSGIGQKQGTGLGLFIAKGIVDAHGGKIWAESELGRGATFHFVIPGHEGA